jgi:ribonuclease HI
LIHIYTDGGCSGNPGPGGWAYVIIEEQAAGNGAKKEILAEKWGAVPSTTNNRMELQAVIAALEAFSPMKPGGEKVTVYTDSQYVQKGMTVWLGDWKIKGWKTSGKKQVKNQDLWLRLDSLAAGIGVSWVWVRGHAGNKYNERCDAMTQKALASLAG